MFCTLSWLRWGVDFGGLADFVSSKFLNVLYLGPGSSKWIA